MRDNDSMLKGSVASALVRFAMPLMLANIFQVLYGAVDLFVVGNFATTADVSGVSTGSIMMNVIFINISALTTGCTVVIGQLTGAKKWDELGKAVGSAIAFFGAIAIGCAVALIAFVNVIIAVLNAPAEAIAQTRDYIVICSAGLPLNIGYTLTSCIMRGRGNSKAPLLFVAVACVVNIVTDLLLVAKFNMGAAGAALATIMSQGFSLLFAIVYLRRRGLGFPFSLKNISFRGGYIRKILKVGAPLCFEEMVINIAFLLINNIGNTMGLAQSAAVGVVGKIVQFLNMPTFAMMHAVTTMTSQNIGANQPERAKKGMWIGVLINASLMLIINILTWIKGDAIAAFFTKDPDVVYNSYIYLKSYGLDCFMLAIMFNMNSYFSGSNRSLYVMLHSIISTLLIRIPLLLLIRNTPGMTLFHIGLCTPFATFCSIIASLIYLAVLNKKEQKAKLV